MSEEKIVAIIQARMGSSRFPGKMLAMLRGIPLVEWVVKRVRRSRLLDDCIVAIPEGEVDEPLARHLATLGAPVHRGPEQDVLARFHQAALKCKATTIVRVCADNPLVCPDAIDALIDFFRSQSPDCRYAYNHIPLNNRWPDGLGAEICSMDTLATLHREATDPVHREHVFEFLKQDPERFPAHTFDPVDPRLARPDLKLDVDHQEDLDHLNKFAINPQLNTHALLELLDQASRRRLKTA